MPLHGLKLIENTLKHGIEVVTTKQHPAEMAMADHWTMHWGIRGKHQPTYKEEKNLWKPNTNNANVQHSKKHHF